MSIPTQRTREPRRALTRPRDPAPENAAELEPAAIAATEPTEQGLQYVIPGCEKDRSRGPAQGSLF